MRYYYKAIGQNGKTDDGFIDAKTSSEAAVLLRNQSLTPIKIIQQAESSMFQSLHLRKSFSSNDLIFFTRQLSSMLTSGLTLIQALNILHDQVEGKKNLQKLVEGVVVEVEGGSSFSNAIAKYPKIFSPVYISLIRASESAGLLDQILTRLADNLEKQQKLKSQIKSALIYPIIVVLLMFGVMLIMMLFVIPQLEVLYQSLGIELPIFTLILITISSVIITFWPLILVGLAGGIFGLVRWHRTPPGRLAIDRFVLRVPVFGKLIRQSILTEFARTFGLLVGAGSSIVQALKQTANITGNVVYENAVNVVSERIEKGVTVGDALSASPLFPSYLVQMVKIGEQTGKMDDSLLKTSEYYEREVELSVKTLTTALEPMIMIALGIGVGFLLISVITPIYTLTSSF